jgi:hypothetical protein
MNESMNEKEKNCTESGMLESGRGTVIQNTEMRGA